MQFAAGYQQPAVYPKIVWHIPTLARAPLVPLIAVPATHRA
jgi:hypothetical protein